MSADVDAEALDRQRKRWRRARRTLGLEDQADDLFALSGLGGRVPELTVRIVVLPADPDRHRIDFDEELSKLWMKGLKGPFPGQELRWGSSEGATSIGAARFDEAGQGRWGRYAALDHAGALDIGLGDQGGWRGGHNGNGWKGVFYLLPIVATVWEACHVYGQVAETFGLERPCELSVALRQTTGTVLGRFATGWAEPDGWRYTPGVCSEGNILMRREVVETSEGWCKAVAFSVGCQIENAFGSRFQRFRTIADGQVGDFDMARWR